MMNNCPNCNSDNIYIFKGKCTLIEGSGKHYGGRNCFTLWSEEYDVQEVLGFIESNEEEVTL